MFNDDYGQTKQAVEQASAEQVVNGEPLNREEIAEITNAVGTITNVIIDRKKSAGIFTEEFAQEEQIAYAVAMLITELIVTGKIANGRVATI
jgi:hypothetical protein